MLSARILVLAVLLAIPCAAEWTTAQKEWALGTSAVLTKLNDHRYDLLPGTDKPDELAEIKAILDETWNVHSRQDLSETISLLLADEGTTSKIAWNYPRVVSLARWGDAVGYLTEAEAWALIMPTAQRLQHTFTSWQEMGRAYLEERRLFFDNELATRRENDRLYRSILLDTASPWRKYAWDLDLGSEPVTANPAKSAEVILAIHRQGLMCARVRVPDHIDVADHTYDPYLKAIEKAVGCKPRVTGSSYDSKDWILETECMNTDVLQVNRVIAHLSIEAIASQLRREGVTEIFVYLEHEPVGTSELTPPAQDQYVDGGLQWYASTLVLGEPIPDVTLTYGFPPDKVRPDGDAVQLAEVPTKYPSAR